MVEDIDGQSPLAEQLAETPPGAQLATLLASVDRCGMEAGDLLRLAQARQQLVAHQEAQLLADLHAVARTIPDAGPQPGRKDPPGKYPWSETEVAFALRWTYRRASGELILADEVIDRLPAVFTALDAGLIDMPKARVIVDAVGCVDDDLAASVVDKVIEKASQQTTGELRTRLRRLLIAVEPDRAAKQAAQGIRERRVAAYANRDNHLATLSGYELAPHRVAAVMERLDAIARAARTAGDPRSADQIRADTFLDLLVGEGIAVGGPISDGGLDAEDTGATGDRPTTGDDDPTTGDDDPTNGDDDPRARDCPIPGTEAATIEAEPVPWPTEPDPCLADAEPDPCLADPDPADPDPADPDHADRHRDVADAPQVWDPLQVGDALQVAEPAQELGLWAAGVPDPPQADPGWDEPEDSRWLSRFDQLPSSRPAAGCWSCAQIAAQVAGPAAGPLPGPRAGVVELAVPLSTLAGLSELPGELCGFAPVVADIARQVATRMSDAQWRFSVYDPMGRLAHHGLTSARPASDAKLADHQKTSHAKTSHGKTSHRTNRRPGAALTAFVRARDRACVAPGCRRQARSCDIDHTLDWVRGGETEDCNLGVLCKAHHLFKHASGCGLTQLSPGVFVWDTPAGLQYRSRPDQPLIDENELAGLAPPGWHGTDSPDTGWDTPSALGADPDLLSIDDIDILDPGGIGRTDAAAVAVRSGVL